MYTFSISVLLQALLIISMSGAADHGLYRKSLLLMFAFTGSIATMLFISVVPSVYLLGAVLAIISNICFGASFVLLNSFLPVLVRRHPDIQVDAKESDLSNEDDADENLPAYHHMQQEERLLPPTAPDVSQASKLQISHALRLSTRISSYGIGVGYIAAVIVQTLGIGIVVAASPKTNSTTLILRVVLFLIGLWWFVFTIPTALWLRPRPGPPLSFSSTGKQRRTWLGYIAYAWSSLFKTVLRARRLKDVVLFRKCSLLRNLLLSYSMSKIAGISSWGSARVPLEARIQAADLLYFFSSSMVPFE